MKFKKGNILIIFIIVSLFSQLFFAAQVFAAANPVPELPNPLTATTFEDLVNGIASWLYTITIPLSAIVILYAAFLFMTSGGDEEKIKKAKRALTWALVGVGIIVIGTGFIVLIKDLLGVKSTVFNLSSHLARCEDLLNEVAMR